MADIKYSSYVDDYQFKKSAGIKHGRDKIKTAEYTIKDSSMSDDSFIHSQTYSVIGSSKNRTEREEDYGFLSLKKRHTGNSKIEQNEYGSGASFDQLSNRVLSGEQNGTKESTVRNEALNIGEAGSDEESASSYFDAQMEEEFPEKLRRKGLRKGYKAIAEIAGYIKERDRVGETYTEPDKRVKPDIRENVGNEIKEAKKAFTALIPIAVIAASVLGVVVIVVASISALVSVFSVTNSGLSANEQAIWQFLRSEGFTDYAIAGVLGCYGSESEHNPDIVEGEYIEGIPDRDVIMADLDGYCRAYLFPFYDRTGVGYAKRGYLYNGFYYPGLGLAQWTGVRAWRLLHYDMNTHTVSADYINNEWNDMAVQLDFMIHFEQTESFWNSYKNISPKGNETDEDCVRRATEIFFSNVEMPGNHEERFLIDRKAKAVNSFNQARASGGNGTFIWPCPSSHKITSYFGGRSSPGGIGSTDHKGIDISAVIGTEVVAAASGTVVYTGYNSERGNFIKIDHGNGYMTIYQHLNGFNCNKGDIVYAGDVIGYSGNTGHSTGPHLHFEILVDGVPVDPMEYF